MNAKVTLKRGGMAKALERVERQLARKMEGGLVAAGQVLLEKANELVPKDTETLHESGRVTQHGKGYDTTVVVGYGGLDLPPEKRYSSTENKVVERKASDYAVYVHEDLNTAHVAPGQAKFLETPVRTDQSSLREAFRAGATRS